MSVECFTHGAAYENPSYWQNKTDALRVQYAKDNPWVLKYDFGHKELIAAAEANKPVVV
jgi:hypothetical protein